MEKIYLLDDKKGFVALVDSMGNDKSIVNAARVSLNRINQEPFSGKDAGLIKYLLANRHTSPFEHVTFTFHVKTPIFVARQWMRHRTQSYNEISRRYTSEDIEFYVPLLYRKQAEKDRQASIEEYVDDSEAIYEDVKRFSKEALFLYDTLLFRGVAREQARLVLPVNLYTEFFTTVNLWNLFHFLELRTSEHAQLEIRVYAEAMQELISRFVPVSLCSWLELQNLKGE